MLVLFATVSSASLSVSSLTTQIDVVAGSFITKEITVKNTDSVSREVFYVTQISPDGEGIDITHSLPSPFSIRRNSEITLKMYIDTSLLLVPGAYIITTEFSNSRQPQRENPVYYNWSSGGSSVVYNPTPEPTLPDDVPPIIPPEYLDEDLNQYILPLFLFILGLLIVLALLVFVTKRRKQK